MIFIFSTALFCMATFHPPPPHIVSDWARDVSQCTSRFCVIKVRTCGWIKRPESVGETFANNLLRWRRAQTSRQVDKSALVGTWQGEKDMENPPTWQGYVSSIAKKGYQMVFSACWYLDHIVPQDDWKHRYTCDPHDFPGLKEPHI